jgi:hypothetical protein
VKKQTISRQDAKTQRPAKKNLFVLFASFASLREKNLHLVLGKWKGNCRSFGPAKNAKPQGDMEA